MLFLFQRLHSANQRGWREAQPPHGFRRAFPHTALAHWAKCITGSRRASWVQRVSTPFWVIPVNRTRSLDRLDRCLHCVSTVTPGQTSRPLPAWLWSRTVRRGEKNKLGWVNNGPAFCLPNKRCCFSGAEHYFTAGAVRYRCMRQF